MPQTETHSFRTLQTRSFLHTGRETKNPLQHKGVLAYAVIRDGEVLYSRTDMSQKDHIKARDLTMVTAWAGVRCGFAEFVVIADAIRILVKSRGDVTVACCIMRRDECGASKRINERMRFALKRYSR